MSRGCPNYYARVREGLQWAPWAYRYCLSEVTGRRWAGYGYVCVTGITRECPWRVRPGVPMRFPLI